MYLNLPFCYCLSFRIPERSRIDVYCKDIYHKVPIMNIKISFNNKFVLILRISILCIFINEIDSILHNEINDFAETFLYQINVPCNSLTNTN